MISAEDLTRDNGRERNLSSRFLPRRFDTRQGCRAPRQGSLLASFTTGLLPSNEETTHVACV
jgi:hypothetical protein